MKADAGIGEIIQGLIKFRAITVLLSLKPTANIG